MRISSVRISKLSPKVIKLSLKIIPEKKLLMSENYEQSEVEQSAVLSFFNFNFSDDNFNDNLSKNASAAWLNCWERRFYDGHDRKVDGSTPIQASLLHPRIS